MDQATSIKVESLKRIKGTHYGLTINKLEGKEEVKVWAGWDGMVILKVLGDAESVFAAIQPDNSVMLWGTKEKLRDLLTSIGHNVIEDLALSDH